MKVKVTKVHPGEKPEPKTEKAEITSPFIRLESLLKLEAMAGTGGEAKLVIQDGGFRVNGEVCTQRGKKLRPGDVVEGGGRKIRVAAAAENGTPK